MKKIVYYIFIFILIIFTKPIFAQEKQYFVGKIRNLKIINDKNSLKKINYQIEINNNQLINITQIFDEKLNFKIKDKVIVYKINNQYFIEDYYRLDKILIVFLFFLIITFIILGKNSLGVIFSIFFSIFILFTSIIPNINAGYDPIIASLFACTIIIPVNFYLSHGFSKKTTIAIIGTFIALIITGVLSYLASIFLKISAKTSEELNFYQVLTNQKINFFGIYLAGIIIALSGILDDVTVTQVSIVFKLKESIKKISSFELYKKALDVGKDHIKSVVNTIIIIYVGSNLPLILLLYLYSDKIFYFLNYEIFAQEIVRSLISTIGLMISIPATTFLATKFNNK